jgi:Kef-type K+ transport system membrane component KefB
VRAWREKVGHFVLVFFLPILFTYTGLRTNVNSLDSPALWGWCLLLLLLSLATIGKFLACYLAARRSGLDIQESKAIGIMMNTRVLMELIVINARARSGGDPAERIYHACDHGDRQHYRDHARAAGMAQAHRGQGRCGGWRELRAAQDCQIRDVSLPLPKKIAAFT